MPTDILLTDAATLTTSQSEVTQCTIATHRAQESEHEKEMLALVSKHTDAGLLVTDAQAKIEWINEGFSKMSGYMLSEVRGRGLERILKGPDTDMDTIINFCRAIKDGQPFDADMLIQNKAGESHWLNFEIRPVRNEQGEVVRFIAIETDITHRKQQEIALERSERRVRSIFETASDAIVVIQADGEIMQSNTAANEMFGAGEEGLIGTNVSQLIPEPHASNHQAYVENFRDEHKGGGLAIRREIVAKRLNGELFSAELSASAAKVGGEWLFTGLLSDITERKALEGQLVQSRKMESIGSLAAGVAHEINTPMQYVNGNIEFLKNAYEKVFLVVDAFNNNLELPEKSWEERKSTLMKMMEDNHFEKLRRQTPEAIDEAFEGIQRVIEIVRAMKVMAHPGGKDKTMFDLNELVRNTVTISRNSWKYAVELELDLQEPLREMAGFPSDLRQVVLNLIVNAADAIVECNGKETGKLGALVIRTSEQNDVIKIEVTDSGCGVPEEIRERVFDPFFTTKEVGKGSGQGLAITYDIVVNKHGGSIDLQSELGVGTTFVVTLPREDKPLPKNKSEQSAIEKSELAVTL